MSIWTFCLWNNQSLGQRWLLTTVRAVDNTSVLACWHWSLTKDSTVDLLLLTHQLWPDNYAPYCDTGHPLIMVISEDPWHSPLALEPSWLVLTTLNCMIRFNVIYVLYLHTNQTEYILFFLFFFTFSNCFLTFYFVSLLFSFDFFFIHVYIKRERGRSCIFPYLL